MADKKTRFEIDDLKRKVLFVPCDTKEDLHRWIILFLGIDLPDVIVDPDSTSCPMDMVWEVYSRARANDENFMNVMYYASRDSFKTLGAAILEVLAVEHLRRNVAHMAAIEAQSRKSQDYVKDFFGKSILRDYVSGDNLSETLVTRFRNRYTGVNLSRSQWELLPQEERDNYEEFKNYIRIVICTMAGANSEHVPFFVVDEVDVVTNPKAYEDSKMIPSQFGDMLPITMMISTRKSSTGLVQQEIDNEFDPMTGERRTWIRHWNILDVTRRCLPTRHMPEEPRIPIYVNDDQLRAISQDKYDSLNPAERLTYHQEEGYTGCLKNCRIFSACHGYLATRQTSNSPFLKKIEETTQKLSKVKAPTAIAQLLCKKPSSEGLIYPNFERSTHVLTASEMAEKILGFPVAPDLTKKDLIEIMRSRDMLCYAGLDPGWSHNFAVVTIFVDGYRAFVVDVIAEPEMLPDAQINTMGRIKGWNPVIFPDPEDPRTIALLRKAGFRMREWSKGPGSVEGGINIVHLRLRPPLNAEPLIYFLGGDPGVELLIKRIQKYHWKVDAAGRLTNKPNEKDDDECDAFRYVIMNVFAPERGRLQVAEDGQPLRGGEAPPGVYTTENWMERVKEDLGAYGGGGGGLNVTRGRFKVAW